MIFIFIFFDQAQLFNLKFFLNTETDNLKISKKYHFLL